MSEAQHIDLAALKAQRAQAQQAEQLEQARQVAALPAPVQQAVQATLSPQVDPLERMLSALRIEGVRPSLPPVAVAERFDQRLGAMLLEAQRLHGAAFTTAQEWNAHRPGTRLFEQECLQADDEVELAELVINAQAIRWAAAYMAQRRALAADQAARDYGHTSRALRHCLEEQAALLRAHMTELLEQCIKEKRPRYRDEAAEVRAQWQPLRALQHWCEDPRQGWAPLHDSETPEQVVPVWERAMVALGEEPPEPTREGSTVYNGAGQVVKTSGTPLPGRR